METSSRIASLDWLPGAGSIRKVEIGIRSQAIIVMFLTTVWYGALAIFLRHVKENINFVWDIILFYFPFVAFTFFGIMLWSYYRGNRPHPNWVIATTMVVISPVVFVPLFGKWFGGW